jgi:hypothetical protein
VMSRISIFLGERGSTPDTVPRLFPDTGVDDAGCDDDLERKERNRAISSWGLQSRPCRLTGIGDCSSTVRYLVCHTDKYV